MLSSYEQENALILNELLENKCGSLEKAAKAIGDKPERLRDVLDGKADLGMTAKLAIIAVLNDIEPISAEEYDLQSKELEKSHKKR